MRLDGVRSTAFGVLNSNERDVGENISKALCKAEHLVLELAKPTTKGLNPFPMDSLRRELAQAMCLPVVFAPRMVQKTVQAKYKNSRMPGRTRTVWEESPVWKTAPTGAYRKANRLSSLLHIIVARGWAVPNRKRIIRDLVRLSINIWTMSLAHFTGLCRRIFAYITKSKVLGLEPEPTLRFGALSVIPILRIEYFLKPRRRGLVKRLLGVKRLPKDLGLAVILRNGRSRRPP